MYFWAKAVEEIFISASLLPKITTPMSALIVLLSISLLVAGGFLIAFIWSVRQGQYDDDYTPSIRILFDDKEK
jgi:cbb3-type cytochrome oxidase maturation protein